MSEQPQEPLPPPTPPTPPTPPPLAETVAAKARRRIHAKKNSHHEVWFGLGMMGLIGWSVVVPTLLGAALGTWLDARYPGQHAWTLALLIAGLSIGCLNAWYWVEKEDRAMHEDREDDND